MEQANPGVQTVLEDKETMVAVAVDFLPLDLDSQIRVENLTKLD